MKLDSWSYEFLSRKRSAFQAGESSTTPSSTYWDSIARQRANKSYQLDPFLGELKKKAYLTLIQRWGGIPLTGRILKTDLFEEAMGPDAFLTELSRDSEMTIGMDVSSTTVRQAQSRNTNRRISYTGADTCRLPFADNSFALIVSPSTLDHFPESADLGRSLKELKRVLEPGGRLIITLDNRQNITDFLLRLAIRLRKVPFYIGRSYTIHELRNELEAVGLIVQDSTAIVHNPRLVAVGAVAVANRLRWRALTTMVHRVLAATQRLEKTRWCYYSGCFVAAKVVKPYDK